MGLGFTLKSRHVFSLMFHWFLFKDFLSESVWKADSETWRQVGGSFERHEWQRAAGLKRGN